MSPLALARFKGVGPQGRVGVMGRYGKKGEGKRMERGKGRELCPTRNRSLAAPLYISLVFTTDRVS